MIASTNSFKRIKDEQQKIWDFAVLLCHSVPALKKTIKGVEESIPQYGIPKSDYFTVPENKERLKSLSQKYRYNLGKYIILSTFSFFESYFKSVVQELIDFHGGKDAFCSTLKEKCIKELDNDINPAIIGNKRKLQEPFKQTKWQKYQKHSRSLLLEPSFRFPSELFSGSIRNSQHDFTQ